VKSISLGSNVLGVCHFFKKEKVASLRKYFFLKILNIYLIKKKILIKLRNCGAKIAENKIRIANAVNCGAVQNSELRLRCVQKPQIACTATAIIAPQFRNSQFRIESLNDI
jgi:hypothetical protein